MSDGSSTSTSPARDKLVNAPPRTPSRSRTPTAFHFLAGLFTGSLSALLLQPADLLKTRVQQSRGSSLSSNLRAIFAQPNSTVVQELWRGTLPSVIRTGFGSALYFTSLNALRTGVARSQAAAALLKQEQGGVGTLRADATAARASSSALPKLSNTVNLATGAAARATAGMVMMPITVLKVRFESSMVRYPSLLSAGRDIFRTSGTRGFFAGYGATLVRDAPYAGLYVLFYERLKGAVATVLPVGGSSNAAGSGGQVGEAVLPASLYGAARVNFVAGCLAAGMATAVTNPFDAVKTRLQLMPGRYKNMVVAVTTMVREEGPRSLFDGLGLRVARKAMSSALAWTIYEELVRRAEIRWKETAA